MGRQSGNAVWHRKPARHRLPIAMVASVVVIAALWLGHHSQPPAYSKAGYHICQDGWISPSFGPGTCSHHGGERH